MLGWGEDGFERFKVMLNKKKRRRKPQQINNGKREVERFSMSFFSALLIRPYITFKRLFLLLQLITFLSLIAI